MGGEGEGSGGRGGGKWGLGTPLSTPSSMVYNYEIDGTRKKKINQTFDAMCHSLRKMDINKCMQVSLYQYHTRYEL